MEGKPSTFGAYTVDSAIGDGRFGPLFHARDPHGLAVVVRTFTHRFTDAELERFVSALQALCEKSLDHPSIARPLACGVERGRPYLVHACLPGTNLTVAGRPALGDIVLRLTDVAGALDFAAAAGVLHGSLSSRDIILSTDSAGVSGFGLVQALEAAGIPGFRASRADDVAALAEIIRDLLGDDVSSAVVEAMSKSRSETALGLVATLHDALEAEPPFAAETALEVESGPAPAEPEATLIRHAPRDVVQDDLFDVSLRDEPPQAEPIIEREPEPDVAPVRAMFGTLATDAADESLVRERRSRGWFVTGAIALALGIFAGGFFVARVQPPSAPVVSTPAPPPEPEPTNGRAYTDAPVDAASPPATDIKPQPAPEPVRPATVPSRPVPAKQPAPAPPSGPAAMKVDSLPAGAQVFVDGRSVGYTPMIVGDLAPGTHSIRMQLPGYRPWVSAVTLGPGARERVAASLEP